MKAKKKTPPASAARKKPSPQPSPTGRGSKQPDSLARPAGEGGGEGVRAVKKEIAIGPIKGRPMLQWFGKRPLQRVTAFPAQQVEAFGPTDPNANLLFHGDNKEVLAHLLANGYRGKVNLIYIDPPFDSGADYVRKVTLRGKSALSKLDGEGYTLGEQVQYEDIWANDNYLQFMYERFALIKELLSQRGVLVVHCDYNRNHYLRMLMDEVVGSKWFINEIIWQHAVIGAGRGIYTRLPKVHETLLAYSLDAGYTFNTDARQVRVPYKERITENLSKDENGWYYTRGRTGTDNPWSKDPKYLRTYVDIEKGKLVHDLWEDITTYRAQGDEHEGYPTQKPEKLIERVVALFSNPGDLVLDCFLGSGTTASVAQKLGRRWIGCDINKGAIQTTVKRLQAVIGDQSSATGEQKVLPGMESRGEGAPAPASKSFHVWRVNDYDLQIQHNEAVALACEHIGVERSRTDAFFDGIQGKRLVKIVPFNHPLSPADLEDLKNELQARKNEERDILMVCLGMERACAAWLEDWNRLRKKGNVPNKIEVVELRTDPKYGKFIAHRPASARVAIKRAKDKLVVEVKDFVSPSILERLESQAGLLKPHIEDWRSMVDSVMIDPAYDGSVFHIALADVPEKKTDLVSGSYELPAPKAKTAVAVKLTDMLGEEVLVVEEV